MSTIGAPGGGHGMGSRAPESNGVDKPSVVPSMPFPPQLLGGGDAVPGLSSVETLLLNIQGLLKVAAENARHREQQNNYEKGE